MTELAIIVAISDNNVIGKNDKLPWSIPEDLKRFRKLTIYCPVIMGRKTYDLIIKHSGEPLDKCINNVLTSRKNYKVRKGVQVFSSLDDVIFNNWQYNKCYIIGGVYLNSSFYEDRPSRKKSIFGCFSGPAAI